MAAFVIRDRPDRLTKFKAQYGFQDERFSFRCAEEGECLSKEDSKHGLPIPTAAFLEGGVCVPFSPLLVSFLQFTNLLPTQLVLNTFRIISSIDVLNKKLGVQAGLVEIFRHYKLILSSTHNQYYLSLRGKREPLVTHLPDSNPGVIENSIFVYGPVDGFAPRPEDAPTCPRVAGRPSKTINHFVDEQANAEILKIITDYRVDEHCRAPHILLNYKLRYHSFSTATIPQYWRETVEKVAEAPQAKKGAGPSTKKDKSSKRKKREPTPEPELEKVASRTGTEGREEEEEEVQSQRISADSEETELIEMDPPHFSAPPPKKQKKSSSGSHTPSLRTLMARAKGQKTSSPVPLPSSGSGADSAQKSTTTPSSRTDISKGGVEPSTRPQGSIPPALDSAQKGKGKASSEATKKTPTPSVPVLTLGGSASEAGRDFAVQFPPSYTVKDVSNLPELPVPTDNTISGLILPEYTFRSVGNLLRFPADMSVIRRQPPTDLSHNAVTWLIRGVQHVLAMGDLLTSQEDQFQLEVARVKSSHERRHQEAEANLKAVLEQLEGSKAEAAEYKKAASSSRKDFDLLNKDHEDLKLELQKLKEDNASLSQEKESLEKEKTALVSEIGGLKASISEKVKAAREETEKALTDQLEPELDSTYQLAWDTLVELASPQFPDIAKIPFVRKVLPEEPEAEEAEDADEADEGNEPRAEELDAPTPAQEPVSISDGN